MMFNRVVSGLVVAGLLLAGSFALKYAEHAGWIAHGVASRGVHVAIGLALAAYANFIPKAVKPSRNPEAARRMQSALRVSGWSFALGGLLYAAAWAFAPLALAGLASVIAVAPALTITLAYTVWACALAPRREA